MESKTKNKKTRAQIDALARQAFNGLGLAQGDEAVSELKEGWFNVAYNVRLADGREVILKIAPPGDAEVMTYEKNIMSTEVTSMRLVRANPAIPVPEIYFFDQMHDLCDSDYFFMQKLDGENLAHLRESLAPDSMAHIQFQVGAIIRSINSFPGVFFGYDGNPDLRAETWKEAFLKILDALLEDGCRKNVELGCTYAELRALVEQHTPALEEVSAPYLVHWDAWDSNFFVKGERVTGIIDFERALWADPLMEAQFRRFDFTTPDCLRGYGKTTFTPAEEQRNHLYTLHLALVMNIECFYRNYDTDFVYKFSTQVLKDSLEWLRNN